MRNVNTRQKTKEELATFTIEMQKWLDDGRSVLIDHPDAQATHLELHEWLEQAIDNVQTEMYKCEKCMWGETNQNQRFRKRAACVKATKRCNGQLRKILREHQCRALSCQEISVAMQAVVWPKWVRIPGKIPDSALHKASTTIFNHWINNVTIE